MYDDESSEAVLLKFSGIDWVGYRRKMSQRETCLACERTEHRTKSQENAAPSQKMGSVRRNPQALNEMGLEASNGTWTAYFRSIYSQNQTFELHEGLRPEEWMKNIVAEVQGYRAGPQVVM